MKKFKYIDALRGIAILGVLITHVTAAFPRINPLMYNIGHNGNKGVQLFFIISAFTLLISYKSQKQFNLTNFFIRRFFRIAPAFYSALVFYLIMFIIFNHFNISSFVTYTHSFSNLLATITFTNMLHMKFLFSYVPGGWSISNEFLFYLILPVIFKFITNIKKSLTLTLFTLGIGFLTTLFSLKMYNFQTSNYIYFYYWFINQLPIFTFGITLYYLLQHKEDINKFINFKKFKYVYFGLLLGTLILIALSNYTSLLVYFNHYFFGINFVFLIYIIAQLEPKFIVNTALVNLGKISFSMYLFHFFFIDIYIEILKRLDIYSQSSIIQLLFILMLTLFSSTIVSILSYKYIEKPGIKLSHRLTKNKAYRNV